MSITYQELHNWKYRLVKPVTYQSKILGISYDCLYYSITLAGLVTGKVGYAWDGATGAPDSKDIFEGAAIHDILCQMMREGILSREIYFDIANKALVEICLSKKMPQWYANLVYWMVTNLGKKSTFPSKYTPNKIVIIEP
jgi:hypothetical protein